MHIKRDDTQVISITTLIMLPSQDHFHPALSLYQRTRDEIQRPLSVLLYYYAHRKYITALYLCVLYHFG